MNTGDPVASLSPDSPGENDRLFTVEVRRWAACEIVLGGASLILLISLFTPWFPASRAGCPAAAETGCRTVIPGSVDGLTVHGYLWVTLPATAVILASLVLHAGLHPAPPARPPAYRLLLAGAAGVNLLLVLVAFFGMPGLLDLPGHPGSGSPRPVLDVSWEYGADVAVTAAAVALVAAVLNAVMARTAAVTAAPAAEAAS